MRDTLKADLVSIRRAFMRGGRVGAMAEFQRRYPEISGDLADMILARILTVRSDAVDRALVKLKQRGDG